MEKNRGVNGNAVYDGGDDDLFNTNYEDDGTIDHKPNLSVILDSRWRWHGDDVNYNDDDYDYDDNDEDPNYDNDDEEDDDASIK